MARFVSLCERFHARRIVIEAATRVVLWKKLFLRISQYSQEITCVGVLLIKLLVLKTPTQVFSCEYCEIVKSTYSKEHLRTAALVFIMKYIHINALQCRNHNCVNPLFVLVVTEHVFMVVFPGDSEDFIREWSRHGCSEKSYKFAGTHLRCRL